MEGFGIAMATISPRCVARSYASSRTSHVPRYRAGLQYCNAPLLGSGEDPGPQRRLQTRPGVLQGAGDRPRMAALPAAKYMANQQHPEAHAILWMQHTHHMLGDDKLLNVIL